MVKSLQRSHPNGHSILWLLWRDIGPSAKMSTKLDRLKFQMGRERHHWAGENGGVGQTVGPPRKQLHKRLRTGPSGRPSRTWPASTRSSGSNGKTIAAELEPHIRRVHAQSQNDCQRLRFGAKGDHLLARPHHWQTWRTAASQVRRWCHVSLELISLSCL